MEVYVLFAGIIIILAGIVCFGVCVKLYGNEGVENKYDTPFWAVMTLVLPTLGGVLVFYGIWLINNR